MNYIKTRREDNVCNICCKIVETNLSWDHVPPKGGIDLSAVEIRDYTNNFNPMSKNMRESQSGLKYRTICKSCNERLGSSYDKCFNLLMLDVKKTLLSLSKYPDTINIETKPTKFIKAILAHLLATKTTDCDSIIDKITRDYLFDKDAVLSKDIRIYCWIYPYDCTIVRNNILQLDPMNPQSVHYSVIKSFPLGFAISYQSELDFGFTDITIYNDNNDDMKCTIPLNFNRKYGWDYPENIRYSGVQGITKNTNDVFVTKKKR